MVDYQQYEDDCKKIREVNAGLLTGFEAWLVASRLAPKTMVQHIANVDLFINEYLLYEDAVEAAEGVHCVNMYFGYWFVHKVSWATPGNIKSNAASIKKFYAFMLAKGLVTPQDLDSLVQTIKQEMPTWLAQLQRFDQELSEMDDDD